MFLGWLAHKMGLGEEQRGMMEGGKQQYKVREKQSLRGRQIDEILDEDKKYYNEVLKREFQQVRLMNESFAQPNRLDRRVAFEIDRYFIGLATVLDKIVNDFTAEGQIQIEDISKLIAAYQTLISYINRFANSHPLNQRDLAAIEDKFDAFLPKLEQVVAIADEQNLPQKDELNALYRLIESRDYISLSGNIQPIKGRRQMLVNREASSVFPHFDPYPSSYYESDTNYYRSQSQVRDDTDKYNEEVVEESKPTSGREQHREVSRSPSRSSERPQSRGRTRQTWQVERQSSQTPLKKEDLIEFLRNTPDEKIEEAIQNIPHLKKENEKLTNAQMGRKIMNNQSYMRDIYTYLNEGIAPTENVPTPRGKKVPEASIMREASLSADPNWRQTLLEHPEYEEDEEGSGKGSAPQRRGFKGDSPLFVKTKPGRFQMKGKGESEDKMFGLPYGFKKALDLRPIDKKPIVHYNGQDFDLTLEDRMEFLNQLDSHKIPDEEFKLNSIKNLSEMRDTKKKKKGKK
jgi:hypothetical protein